MSGNKKDDEMICALTADEQLALSRGLAALPETMPPRDVWRRIREQGEAEGLLREPGALLGQRPLEQDAALALLVRDTGEQPLGALAHRAEVAVRGRGLYAYDGIPVSVVDVPAPAAGLHVVLRRNVTATAITRWSRSPSIAAALTASIPASSSSADRAPT